MTGRLLSEQSPTAMSPKFSSYCKGFAARLGGLVTLVRDGQTLHCLIPTFDLPLARARRIESRTTVLGLNNPSVLSATTRHFDNHILAS